MQELNLFSSIHVIHEKITFTCMQITILTVITQVSHFFTVGYFSQTFCSVSPEQTCKETQAGCVGCCPYGLP